MKARYAYSFVAVVAMYQPPSASADMSFVRFVATPFPATRAQAADATPVRVQVAKIDSESLSNIRGATRWEGFCRECLRSISTDPRLERLSWSPIFRENGDEPDGARYLQFLGNDARSSDCAGSGRLVRKRTCAPRATLMCGVIGAKPAAQSLTTYWTTVGHTIWGNYERVGDKVVAAEPTSEPAR